MSVNHRASIIYGIKISAETHKNLPESFLEKYEDEIHPINSYDDDTEYIVGIILHSVAEGYYSQMSPMDLDAFTIKCPNHIEEMFWDIENNSELADAVPRPTYRRFYLVGVIS